MPLIIFLYTLQAIKPVFLMVSGAIDKDQQNIKWNELKNPEVVHSGKATRIYLSWTRKL